ncbi:hypothetical protein ABIE26_002413 [Pedobacter africanus]|uniref:Uncharacterized protein n=1 Tax=Pedobacter africanus TaxID=151894 RepID=A0ACC6KXV7_9SPHI|nr:hypothetical protein [Pedobacter africanus]
MEYGVADLQQPQFLRKQKKRKYTAKKTQRKLA